MKILITAGPTYEHIDPVRFIGNYSTGKMGFALAETCAKRGHEVILIAGPVQQQIALPNVKRIDVESAQEMYEAVMENYPTCDGAILCAAVADFTPITTANKKLKRGNDNLIIELKPTKDIAVSVGNIKKEKQFLVGFALETNDEEANALKKMQRKKFDFIVLNSLNDKNACFGYDTNKITIIDANGKKNSFQLKPKKEVAQDIINHLEQHVPCL
jgi:phosphopantothenoylcysteine decarboxylase / phosphopantothenate---cysteine ligase